MLQWWREAQARQQALALNTNLGTSHAKEEADVRTFPSARLVSVLTASASDALRSRIHLTSAVAKVHDMPQLQASRPRSEGHMITWLVANVSVPVPQHGGDLSVRAAVGVAQQPL